MGRSTVAWLVLFAAGGGVALITYVGGDPIWVPAFLLFAAPAVWLVRKVSSRPRPGLSSFLRRYRILIVIYGMAVALAACEMRLKGTFPAVLVRSFPELAKSPGEASLLLEPGQANYTDALMKLYPSRPEATFAQGFQAKVCVEQELLLPEPSEVCEKFVGKDLHEARRYYEQALTTGIKSNEYLFYSYAEILIKLGEDQEKIDAAMANWYRNFPYTKLLDPRKTKRDRRRQTVQ